MIGTITIEKLAGLRELIDTSSRIAIVSHARPDGDAVGSSCAMYHYLRALGKHASVLLPSAIPDTISFAAGEADVIICEQDAPSVESALSECDLVVCVDFNTFSRTDDIAPLLEACASRKVLIDHHLFPDVEKFDLVFSEAEISSACELEYYILKGLAGGTENLPKSVLECLMVGMTTDTNNFANSVHPSTMQMCSELLAAGVDRDAIISKLYQSYRENRIRAFAHILDKHLTVREDGLASIMVSKSVWERFELRDGELEGLVNVPLGIAEVKMVIYLREGDDTFRVSVRSKDGYSANQVARTFFHGGGHEKAAGGKLIIGEDVNGLEDAAQYLEKIKL